MIDYHMLESEKYPHLLKQVKLKPKKLYIAGGNIPDEQTKYLCVVGARKYSDYGHEACYELIRGLAGYRIVIVSGLALGIDSLAHRAALEFGIPTIAVPGSGLDARVLSPQEHLPLAEHIVESGNVLLSPFEPYQYGTNWTFPVRNQLMASMSHAVLIVEGRKNSGTLLTASYATELSRDVMIVPGSIFSELSYGPHSLHSQGAVAVANSREILETLSLLSPRTGDEIPQFSEGRDLTNDPSFQALAHSLSDDEKIILPIIALRPANATYIIDKSCLTASRFNMAISRLELRGLVREVAGTYKMTLSNNS